jgi:hypothetical protein
MTPEGYPEIDLREQIIRIDRMLVDIDRKREDTLKIIAEHDRTRQEIKYAPWLLVLGSFSAGAATIGGGVALLHLWIK